MPRPGSVQIPGVTSFSSGAAEPAAERSSGELEMVGVDEADSVSIIASLRAQLAATNAELQQAREMQGKVLAGTVFEPETPHGAIAKKLSSHLHLTTTQLTAMIKAGEVDLGNERMVLCADGYFINPRFA